MSAAVSRYNRLTTRPSKTITAQYVPGVQTADGNFNGQSFALHRVSNALVWPIPSVCEISWRAVRSFMYDLLDPKRMLPLKLPSAVCTLGTYCAVMVFEGRVVRRL